MADQPESVRITKMGIAIIEEMAERPGWAPPGLAPLTEEERQEVLAVIERKRREADRRDGG